MPLLDEDLDREVRRQLPLLTLGRLVGNGIFRLATPFLGAIGRGLGVPITTMGAAASAGDFTGLLAPAVGRRLDRGAHVSAMTIGMAIIAAGALLAAVSPGPVVIGAAFVLVSFGKLMYDPAVSAWASERVPYERRARVIGFIELSWAGSMLLVVPVAGVVVALAGWRWAYGLLAVAAAAMTVAVRRRARDDAAAAAAQAQAAARDGVVAGGGAAADVAAGGAVRFRFTPPVLAGLVGFGLLMTAVNSGFVVFGAWLGDAFGYRPAVIGLAGVLLGVMELIATTSTIRFTDRLGKRTAVMVGAALMVPTGALLGTVGHRAWLGLGLFALFVLGFEFAIVSGLPLIAELQTDARASGLGLAIGFGTVGRGFVSIGSTRLYDAHGIGGSGLLAAACAAGVVVVYGWGLRGHTRLH